jgi:hypothetical protein
MRTAGIIAIIIVLMVLLAGCGQRVPTRNTTGMNTWGNTTPKPGSTGSAVKTTVVPVTTSPFVQATPIPSETVTVTPEGTYRNPPPPENITANLTLLDEKKLVFVYNRTAYTYNLQATPLLIEYTLTVPNISKTRVVTDPVSGSDRVVSITYPDPQAFFEVTVKDLETKRIIARDGYGGQYDVSYSKKIWVRYPGSYYIEFYGNKVTADIHFKGPGGTLG